MERAGCAEGCNRWRSGESSRSGSPSKVREPASIRRRASPRATSASPGVACASESWGRPGIGLSGSRSRPGVVLPARLRGLPRLAPFEVSSLALGLSFRVLRIRSAHPRNRRPMLPTPTWRPQIFSGIRFGRLPWGFVPLRDIRSKHRLADSHRPRQCRPRRLVRPRRFVPLRTWRMSFNPPPRPGFALQGFSPSNGRAGSRPS